MLKSAQMEASFADIAPNTGGTITYEQWQAQQGLDRAAEQKAAIARVALIDNRQAANTERVSRVGDTSFAGAPCREEGKAELFFEPTTGHETRTQKDRRENAATALCKLACKYQEVCLSIALNSNTAPVGVWGAKRNYELRNLRRDRRS